MLDLELLKQQLKNASNQQQVIDVKNIFIKNNLDPILKTIKDLNPEQKKELGLKINFYKKEIDEITNSFLIQFDENICENNNLISFNDFLLDLKSIDVSTRHIINNVISKIKDFFTQFNFELVNGTEIVDDINNFQRLNIGIDHPARNMHDSLFIDQNLLLRTHCTANTAKLINNNTDDDIRIMSYGNVYRKDDDDPTHSHQFTQIDFVWIKKDINISNLKWLVDEFLKFFFEKDIKTRYRLSFFPFTEPSFEVDISCINCDAKGCSICKHSGWIEIMGAGLLHYNVLESANIKNKQGIAGGIGVERLIMLKYGFNDIRDLYCNNIKINKQFK